MPKHSGNIVDNTLLAEELAPLNAQIEKIQAELETLEAEMGDVEAELEKYATARQRVEALKEVCQALDKLGELRAGELFWKGIFGADAAEAGVAAPPVERVEGLMEDVVVRAARAARPGDVVLLSPACSSYDQYENYERRGAHFAALARAVS